MRSLVSVAKIALMAVGAFAMFGWGLSYVLLQFMAPDIRVYYKEDRSPDGSSKVVFVTHRDANVPPRLCTVSIYVGAGDASRQAIVRAARIPLRGDCRAFDDFVSGGKPIWSADGSLSFPLSGAFTVTASTNPTAAAVIRVDPSAIR